METFNELKRTYYKIRSQGKFLSLVKNPQNTPAIFEMTEFVKRSNPPEVIDRMMAHAYANPAFLKAYEEKYWPRMPLLSELQSLPEGSFGREFANFFEKWNLNPDFYPPPVLNTPSDYLLSRVYQAHDAWHVLTGYTPSVIDELALQAFGVAQYKQPVSTLIISGGLIHLLNTDPEQAVLALQSISEGYERGKKAKHLLTEPVIERFRDPITEVRRDLGL